MKTLALVLFAVLFLVGSVGANADQENDAKELVQKAVQFFSEKGKDYALKVVGTSNGPFRKDGCRGLGTKHGARSVSASLGFRSQRGPLTWRVTQLMGLPIRRVR